MKKILLATIAFSIVATPAAFAQSYKSHPKEYQRKFQDDKRHHRNVKKKRWSKGQHLDRDHRRHVVHQRDYRRYRLYHPPRGHQWVRVGDDYMLVAVTSGIIGAIIGNAIANSR